MITSFTSSIILSSIGTRYLPVSFTFARPLNRSHISRRLYVFTGCPPSQLSFSLHMPLFDASFLCLQSQLMDRASHSSSSSQSTIGLGQASSLYMSHHSTPTSSSCKNRSWAVRRTRRRLCCLPYESTELSASATTFAYSSESFSPSVSVLLSNCVSANISANRTTTDCTYYVQCDSENSPSTVAYLVSSLRSRIAEYSKKDFNRPWIILPCFL